MKCGICVCGLNGSGKTTLDVPLDIRMKRIRQRAIDKFGDRVLPGGDMYEQEEKFFSYAEKRTPEKIEGWLATLSCKVIRLDGTKPIQVSVELIKSIITPVKA